MRICGCIPLTPAIALYIDCLSGLENFKEIKDFIESLSDKLISDKNIQNSINKFKILESASKEPSIELLLSNYNKNPKNIENLFWLSLAVCVLHSVKR